MQYKDNETNPADIADQLHRCNQTPSHPILYGRDCVYPERGSDPCCPTCGHIMIEFRDSDIEPMIADRNMSNINISGA